jgi:hypothetical protein
MTLPFWALENRAIRVKKASSMVFLIMSIWGRTKSGLEKLQAVLKNPLSLREFLGVLSAYRQTAEKYPQNLIRVMPAQGR